MRKELLKGLTDEQIEKASHCKNAEELLALAEKEDFKLTEEQLAAINGGICCGPTFKHSPCPQCGAAAVGEFVETTPGDGKFHFVCHACGHEWIEK